jgi:hypothetical protein
MRCTRATVIAGYHRRFSGLLRNAATALETPQCSRSSPPTGKHERKQENIIGPIHGFDHHEHARYRQISRLQSG